MRIKKKNKTLYLPLDVIEFIEYFAVTSEAGLIIEKIIRRSSAFKKFKKERKHGN